MTILGNDCAVHCLSLVANLSYREALGVLTIEAPIVKPNPLYDGVRGSQLVRALRRVGVACSDYIWRTPSRPVELDEYGLYSIRHRNRSGMMHVVVYANGEILDPQNDKTYKPNSEIDVGGKIIIYDRKA